MVPELNGSIDKSKINSSLALKSNFEKNIQHTLSFIEKKSDSMN